MVANAVGELGRMLRLACGRTVAGLLLLVSFSVPAAGQDTPAFPWTQFPFVAPHGEIRVIFLFVEFPDAPHTREAATLFGDMAPAVQSFFREVSYGKTSYAIDSLQRWLRLPKASTDYGLGQYSKPLERRRAFMQDVVAAADPDVDFRRYRAVVVVHSRNAKIECCWSMGRRWGQTNPTSFTMDIPTNDGVAVQRAAIVSEASRITTIHELEHTMGLPDLYSHDVATGSGTRTDLFVGTWDIMSAFPRGARQGPHNIAWIKWLLGWLPEERIHTARPGDSVTVTLEPLELPTANPQALRIALGGGRSYFLEVRQPVGSDTELPDFGVLITLVDETIPNGKGPLRVMNAHPEAQDFAMRDRYGPFYAAAYDIGAGEVSTFVDDAARVKVTVEARLGRSYRISLGSP